MKYTFGHTKTASERLERISAFFNIEAEEFISENLLRTPNIAIDLGCGPGFSSQMVHEATSAKQTYGLDLSKEFIDEAGIRFPHINFQVHNITEVPFPQSADMMYCRFLLSHLSDVDIVLQNWFSQLYTNGTLFIDELESIETNLPIFQEYLNVSDQLIANQGASLYIGKTLNKYLNNLPVVVNETVELPVPDSMAASWFFPNTVSVWEQEDFVNSIISTEKKEEIRNKLISLQEKNDNSSNICWKMRRIVIEKK